MVCERPSYLGGRGLNLIVTAINKRGTLPMFLGKNIVPPYKVLLTVYNFDPEFSLPSFEVQNYFDATSDRTFSFKEFQDSTQYKIGRAHV